MLRYLIALVALATGLYAQISVSPTSLSFTQRQTTDSPYPMPVAVTGSGNIGVGSCTGNACLAVLTQLSSNSAPATLYVYWNGYNNNGFAPGTYNASVPVTGSSGGGATVNITLTVVAATIPTFSTPSGSITNCSHSTDTAYPPADLDLCAITNVRPGGAFNPPGPGSTYVDPNFGGVVKTLIGQDSSGNPRLLPADAVISSTNLDNSMIITEAANGYGFITSSATGADLYNNVPIGSNQWSRLHANRFYYSSGLTWHQVDLITPGACNVPANCRDQVIYTYTGTAGSNSITGGGDNEISKDDWTCFYSTPDQKVALINLAEPSQVFFGNFPAAPFNPRLCNASFGQDVESGKRYVVVQTFPGRNQGAAELYSWMPGATTLTDEGPLPAQIAASGYGIPTFTGPHCSSEAAQLGNCQGAAHSAMAESNGIQYLTFWVGQSFPYRVVYGWMKLSTGDLMLTAAEAGGGLYYGPPIGSFDVHVGCATQAPLCVFETDGDPVLTAWAVTGAATSGDNIVLTVPGASTLAIGDPILVNGVAGCTAANGTFSAATVGGTITLPGVTCNAPYTGGGFITKNIAPPLEHNQGEIWIADIHDIANKNVTITRLAKHRSFSYANDSLAYYEQGHPNISPDGSLVVFGSNFGFPGSMGIYSIQVPTQPGPGCFYTLSSTSLTAIAGGASGVLTATPSSTTCGALSARSNVSWASVSVSGTTINWSVAANPGSQSRGGSLTIAGQRVTIMQSGSAAQVLTMTVSPTHLAFGINGGLASIPQSLILTFPAGSFPSWTANSSQPNIMVSPTSGIGTGTLQISATAGSSGVVTIFALGVVNSPLTVQIQVTSAQVTPPFGSFDTPVNNARGISAAIAVTGWALDSIGVSKVDIWRESMGSEPAGLIYIGDAVFVPGARPDVAQSFSSYPNANVAGWGYSLLTNFLPNANGTRGPGNGTYTLHALAHNLAGATVDLGARTIAVDNAAATLPFGNIDTPPQGATASGNAYVNFGWALTPMPASIPVDGTTITVNVDGVTVGHPTYNQFRGDVATLFPGFANSNGAIGFVYIDTTTLANGLHTISWNVWDTQVRGNGVGSRFFTVLNSLDVATSRPPGSSESESSVASPQERRSSVAAIRLPPDMNGALSMEVEEMDRIEVPLGATSGYMVANGEMQPLPVGSTLRGGVFYWQLAPVFLGEYDMVFERPGASPTHLRVIVRPKSYSAGEHLAIQ
jgi:hypothetical protein